MTTSPRSTSRDIDRMHVQEVQINLEEDQALVIDRGPDEDNARNAALMIGQSLPGVQRGMVVI